jgi:hypothetical protein
MRKLIGSKRFLLCLWVLAFTGSYFAGSKRALGVPAQCDTGCPCKNIWGEYTLLDPRMWYQQNGMVYTPCKNARSNIITLRIDGCDAGKPKPDGRTNIIRNWPDGAVVCTQPGGDYEGVECTGASGNIVNTDGPYNGLTCLPGAR